MNQRSRYLTAAAVLAVAAAAVGTRACGQEPTQPPPGVRLGLSYPRGTTPKVIVMPVDSTPGDSVRTIIQRDLDYSDRVTPLVLDDMTLMGMTPAPGQDYNYGLFANLGVAAIIQGRRTPSGIQVALYDVSAKRQRASREFRIGGVPPNRDATLLDSITVCDDDARKSEARFDISCPQDARGHHAPAAHHEGHSRQTICRSRFAAPRFGRSRVPQPQHHALGRRSP